MHINQNQTIKFQTALKNISLPLLVQHILMVIIILYTTIVCKNSENILHGGAITKQLCIVNTVLNIR